MHYVSAAIANQLMPFIETVARTTWQPLAFKGLNVGFIIHGTVHQFMVINCPGSLKPKQMPPHWLNCFLVGKRFSQVKKC
jgi:hypothetical protein